MKTHVFIDESGDLGKHGSKFFTIAALLTKNPKPIENMIKKVKKSVRKKEKKLNELKANKSCNVIRTRVLKKVNEVDCELLVVSVAKEQIKDYLYDKKHKLYNYICGLLVERLSRDIDDISIVIDKKDSNRLLREDLNSYLVNKIKSNNPSAKVGIRHMDSTCHRCLQAIDFVAWSNNRRKSYDDSTFFDIIAPSVTKDEYFWKEK